MVAQHVPSNKWTVGAHEVRQLLDLPAGRIKISPKDVKEDYRLFVQSTSWNRKVIKGTHIMLEVTKKQLDKHGDDDEDVKNESETETIGKNPKKTRGMLSTYL